MTARSGLTAGKPASRVLGIQFSVLSPDEIRRQSVVEITTRDTYAGGKPVLGGLFDPRMGTVEPGLLCPTDGHDYMVTPGYFGHLELARPVYYIQFLATVLRILSCVCYKCSKLLISRELHASMASLDPKTRWDKVWAKASKVKRCGESNDDGCGCKQPDRWKKDGVATVTAEWSDLEENAPKTTAHISAERALRILRRISDADMEFMGFSPRWSRPEWMICQVLAVPPPAIRPSVKHDAHQRSEDDISHILINIIKANKTLTDKMSQDAAPNVVDDWTTMLQFYVATMVNNKLPGVSHVTQRSGRPMKSVTERLNGKQGRLRGNLQGKRVDFSARSVITPDPNLGIAQLGVPVTIAKNITFPAIVNPRNIKLLTALVQAGPDEYPGAKTLQRESGETIALRHVDRESIRLSPGDVVHRHLLDGDPVLFNRQPTLHRMSMMCHRVKVMTEGSTFRMNVADTKPYNADFDGDEMNMHGPQSEQAAAELVYLASVPTQIVSPGNNRPIVGIFQDSLLGAFLLTRSGQKFERPAAMNLLMSVGDIRTELIPKGAASSFEILTQIMPPLSCDVPAGADGNRIKVVRGQYLGGQLGANALGATSKGLIHSIFNEYGADRAASFIDELQAVVTDYMKTHAFSVGVSDLVADEKTSEMIAAAITEKKQRVRDLTNVVLSGAFENKTGRPNNIEFETQVNAILNKAQEEAGKIGRKSLSKDNRFNLMVEAGSKGKPLNIAQMIACLGQQNVDGKRIPYGFESRTLPHYTKFDDSPEARGFVEGSFIGGLTPQELFFHAMGGRVGLIDTAVKTSSTGYIQRRIVKALEDLVVTYIGTVVNNQGKIIQFAYGDDGIDAARVETQKLPLVSLPLADLYAHFELPSASVLRAAFTTEAQTRARVQKKELARRTADLVDELSSVRQSLVDNVFGGEGGATVHAPVAFARLISNYQYQLGLSKASLSDVTPLELYLEIDKTIEHMTGAYSEPSPLLKLLMRYHLSPAALLYERRYSSKGLRLLLDSVQLAFARALVQPGEMVGMIAAQSIGEPTTQMTLNTFHFAGVASKSNVTRGVPRIEEILSISAVPKNESDTVWLHAPDMYDATAAQEVMYRLEHTPLRDITAEFGIYFAPTATSVVPAQDQALLEAYAAFAAISEGCVAQPAGKNPSKWIVRLVLDRTSMLDRNLTTDDVAFAIGDAYGTAVDCVYSDYNEESVAFRLRLMDLPSVKKRDTGPADTLDQGDEVHILRTFATQLLDNTVLRGVPGIKKVTMRKVPGHVTLVDGSYEQREAWVLDTVGTNLTALLGLPYVDQTKVTSNNIQEVYRVLGLEAARQTIFNELVEVLEYDGTYINYHHLGLLCDRMTATAKMVSVFRHGINNDDIGPIAKACFEETPEMFLRAARHAQLDTVRGVSANVMLGQEGHFGTGLPSVVLDDEALQKMGDAQLKTGPDIEKAFGVDAPGAACSLQTLESSVSAEAVVARAVGAVPDGYDLGF
jgi:DNA-directed RNA polymerase II subunit RPB1